MGLGGKFVVLTALDLLLDFLCLLFLIDAVNLNAFLTHFRGRESRSAGGELVQGEAHLFGVAGVADGTLLENNVFTALFVTLGTLSRLGLGLGT